VKCEAVEEGGRNLLMAVDRSRGRKIVLYSIVVSSVGVGDYLMKYVDVFKHVKLLGRRERSTYFPRALRVIEVLVDADVLLGVDVTNYLGVLLGRVEGISSRVLVAVVDDYLVKIARSKLEDSLVVAEGSLRRHKVMLENLGLKPSVMYVLLGIADTLLAYTRIQVEDHGRRLRDVRSRMPLKWDL